MKMSVLPWVLLSTALLQPASAARTRLRSQLTAEEHETGKTSLHATIKSMVGRMIESDGSGRGPGTKDIVHMATGRMDLGEAVKQLDGKLPADIAALVRVGSKKGGKADPSYDDDSLQKARRYLNGMMLEGWKEWDTVVFECMGFRLRNRGTYDQVVADLSRLGSQIAALGERKVKAIDGGLEQDRLHKEAKDVLDKATKEFSATRAENSAEMTIRKNDLAVFDFMLNLTSCDYVPPGGSAALLQSNSSISGVKICDGTLHFADAKLQAKMERMMTPAARRALKAVLGETVGKVSLLQEGSSRQTPTVTVDTLPVSEEPHPDGQWKKCVDGPVACGLLHDLMSLEWGKFRDSFDELTAEMTKNQDEYDDLSRNINDQLTVITDAKTEHMETLASCTSALNADEEEQGEKEEQKRTLTDEFDAKCAMFKAKLSEILHTKICAVRKVRNVLMTYSSTTPLSAISDCDFTDWHSKSGECIHKTGKVIFCDDTCAVDVPYDEYNPFQCGGLETMKRDVVVAPNENGMVCPDLEMKRRCAQHLCPVNCLVSQWSGWSKCSKDCEGGIEGRTRSILIKAKNGGTICDAAQEEQACNTGSCDRNCKLQDWTDWAPCSMACGGGFTTRRKKVLIPIRGQGKCPTPESVERWEEDKCNSQACNGDEICIAKQDLIIALDASGSVREEGFNTLREFTVNLTKRYEPEYYGEKTMQVGLVLFGNGALTNGPSGTTGISEAIQVTALTSDLVKLRSDANQQTFQRGFTNMAQALSLADVLLQQGGRSEAQSAVLVLSDGKYSFKYQTAEKAQELKDKNIQLYMAPVIDFEDKDLVVLKSWASQPWETNYERIPGFKALQYNQEIFILKVLVKFCPDSMSPALDVERAQQVDYMMIREGAYPSDACAPWWFRGWGYSLQQCADAARAWSKLSFAHDQTWGGCYTEGIAVTQGEWDTWLVDRINPDPCAGIGGFYQTIYWDTYVFNPSSFSP